MSDSRNKNTAATATDGDASAPHPAPKAPTLRELQVWFQTRLQDYYAPPTTRSAPPEWAADAVVKPSRTLSPTERVAIYQRSIYSRFVECLAADFSCVHALLGADEFYKFAQAYLADYPSRSYTLDRLGQHVPRFLRRPDLRVPNRPLLLDLARLEWALLRVFHGPRVNPMQPDDFSAIPAEELESTAFVMAPTMRVLAFDHAAEGILTALRRGDMPLPDFSPRQTFTLIYRKEFQVWRAPISQPQFAMLRALALGRSVGSAIAAAIKHWEQPFDKLESAVFRWFGEWVQCGLFVGIVRPAR